MGGRKAKDSCRRKVYPARPGEAGFRGCVHHNPRMSARWVTLFVWAAVAASALFWALKLLVTAAQAPPQVQVAEASVAARGDLTRLLGAEAPAALADAAPEPGADARFNLVGVLSPRAPQAAREGVALIAVDGKPARAFRVGTLVDGQNVLQSVNARGAELGPRNGPSLIALKIAPPAPAATGQLPSVLQPSGLPGGGLQRPQVQQPVLVPPPQQAPPQMTPQPAPQPISGQAQLPYSRELSPLK